MGSIDVTYIIEYGDDIKAFMDGRFVLSCERNGYVNPYFTIKYSNEAERLHRFRNYCEHVFKHSFEVKGGDSYVSPLLIKELGLINNNTSKKLSKSDKIYLESIGVSKYDFAQIEDAISAANFYVYKIKDGEDILKLNLKIKDYKKVTFEKAVELVGREVVLSGLSRAAFHFTAGRTANGYDLFIKISFSFFFSGLSGIDEDFADKLNEFILNDYKLNDRQEYFSCGYANNILQACGLDDDKEIIITQGDMKKILGHKKGKMDDAHDLTPIETLRIPQLIQKPILVIKGNTSGFRLIFIEIPRAGRKIFAVVYLDVDMVLKKRGHYNLVASVYSQEEEKIQNKITATAATNDIWYYDSKVIKNWLSSMGQLHLLPLLEANSMYSDKDF